MNLPELPAGYRWKIERAYEVNVIIRIEKLEKPWYWKAMWKQHDFEYLRDYELNSNYTTAEKSIEKRAEEMHKTLMTKINRREVIAEFVGIYGDKDDL